MSYWNPYDDSKRISRPIQTGVSSFRDDSIVSKIQNESQTNKKRKKKKKKRTCPCGNPYKIRELIDNFAKTSTMHGAVYLAGSGKTYLCFWRTLLLVCILGVTLTLISIIQNALYSQSLTISTTRRKADVGRTIHENFPEYPGITICRMPAFESSDKEQQRLYEYSSIALGYPFASLTALEKSFVFGNPFNPDERLKFEDKIATGKKRYEEYFNKNPRFSLKKFLFDNRVKCEHMFEDCIAEMVGLNCCEIFQPVLTNVGTCYFLQPNEGFWHVHQISEKLDGFSFYLDLLAPSPRGSNNFVGFSVFVTDPFTKPIYSDYTRAVMVSPGSAAVFSLTLTLTNRKEFYDTWFGLGGTCPKLPAELEAHESHQFRYSRETCYRKHLTNDFKTFCNCLPVLDYEEGKQYEMRICEPEDFVRCSFASFSKDNASGMVKHCLFPCTEFTYIKEVTYGALDTDKNRCRIVINYAAEDYIYNEYQRYTVSTFFSQIGGTMGLLLGASIITSIEFFAFLVKLIWHRFIPCRRTEKIRNK